MSVLSISKVCKELNLTKSQIYNWEKKLSLNINKNNLGHRLFSENDLEMLNRVKRLKADGLTFQDIAEQLGLVESSNDKTRGNIIQDDSNITSYSMLLESELNTKIQSLRSEIKSDISSLSNDISSITELSEKFSKATYQIGVLTTEKNHLEEKVKLLSNNTEEVTQLKDEVNFLTKINDAKSNLVETQDNEIEKLKKEKQEYQELIQELKEQIPKDNKPWYKRLFRS